jgi:hypothetical protein
MLQSSANIYELLDPFSSIFGGQRGQCPAKGQPDSIPESEEQEIPMSVLWTTDRKDAQAQQLVQEIENARVKKEYARELIESMPKTLIHDWSKQYPHAYKATRHLLLNLNVEPKLRNLHTVINNMYREAFLSQTASPFASQVKAKLGRVLLTDQLSRVPTVSFDANRAFPFIELYTNDDIAPDYITKMLVDDAEHLLASIGSTKSLTEQQWREVAQLISTSALPSTVKAFLQPLL